MNKGLTMKTGQTHMMCYMQPVLERIEAGEIDPSLVISHTLPLARAPIANGHTGNVSKHRVSGGLIAASICRTVDTDRVTGSCEKRSDADCGSFDAEDA
jgi:hypothetical protein